MASYQEDLAFIQAASFGAFAEGAVPFVVSRLLGSRRKVARVIDVGCGAGVSTRALVSAGFEVLALEPSLALLAIAKEAAPQATFSQATAYEHPLTPCEAILALGEPLTYHEPGADAEGALRRFFEKAAGVLPEGGHLIFDFISSEGPSLNNKGSRSEAEWVILFETVEAPATRRLTRYIETFRAQGGLYRRAKEVHEVRLFSEGSICAWLSQAGFMVETARSYGAYPLAPRRVAVLATYQP